MPLEHVEIYVLANHLGNQNAVRTNLPFGALYSLRRPPGALNVTGAISIGLSEMVGGIYIMRVER